MLSYPTYLSYATYLMYPRFPVSTVRDDSPPAAARTAPALLNAHWPWWVFGFLLALNLLKGMRMPGRWAVTHYLFTYQNGFIKRGFFGEILHRLFGGWTASYFLLSAIAIAVLVAVVWLIARIAKRLPDTPERWSWLVVFLASPAIALFAHLVGYLEQLSYLAIAVLLLQRRWRMRVAIAIACAILLPLIHEAALFWAAPLVGLALLLGGDEGAPVWSRRMQTVAAVAALWVVTTAITGTAGRVTNAQMNDLRDDRTRFFEIRPRQDAFSTLTVPLGDAYRDMRTRWADPETQYDMAFSLLVFGPGAIFLILVATRQARRLDLSDGARRVIVLGVVAAVAAPMLLHIIGWDRHRWNALATLNAGLAGLIVLSARVAPTAAPHRSTAPRSIAIALAISLWSIAADPVLFDSYGDNHPPFGAQIRFLIDAIRSPNRAMWMPKVGQ